MDDTPFRMTFGIELEFFVRYDPEDYYEELLAGEGVFWPTGLSETHHKYGALICLEMIQILRKNGFSTNDFMFANSSKWTVLTDDTVIPNDTSGNWYPIELKSPAFFCSDRSLEDIKMVVELLGSKFQLYTNNSCGFHVHVGNRNRGFSLSTLKRFCSLITVFDYQLDSLHPRNRRQNVFAKSMRRVFDRGTSLEGKLAIIDELKSVRDLISRVHNIPGYDWDKCMAFNFGNLLEELDRPLRTIEFRQHQGTLDLNQITNWIKVVCELVKISHEGAYLDHLISKHMYNTKYTIIDLFKDLGLLPQAKFYAQRIYKTDQYPAWVDELIQRWWTED